MIGTRWFYRSFSSDHHGGQFSNEHFHTWDLWGQFLPTERLQIVAILPFNHFTRTLETQRTVSQGIGDLVALIHYNTVRHAWGENSAWKQQWWLGGGIKWPTGKFDPALIQQGINPNMQPGTGAPDAILSTMYALRYNRWGIAYEALFRLCTPNTEGYRFGNRLNTSARLFFQTQTGPLRWMPTLGAAYEWSAEDRNQGNKVPDTGGYCLLGQVGLDIFSQRVALSMTWQTPLSQHLGNGFLQARQRIQIGASVLF